jgi:REP element-mobilizing transposase RayT
MAVRKQIAQPDGVFFITFTCADWLPLFTVGKCYQAVYSWFDHLQLNGHAIISYVIMPNHVHAIIAFRNTGKAINTTVSNGKRFMAYELVKQLEQNGQQEALGRLKQLVSVTERQQGKNHRVFEPSFDWKECRTTNFIIQKLNYIHWNPCKVGLCKTPEEYEHSSAKFYIEGEHKCYRVRSYMELEDMDLTLPL